MKVCVYCGTEIIGRRKRKYCSYECQTKYQNRVKREKFIEPLAGALLRACSVLSVVYQYGSPEEWANYFLTGEGGTDNVKTNVKKINKES